MSILRLSISLDERQCQDSVCSHPGLRLRSHKSSVAMATVCVFLLLSASAILGFAGAESDYCKRGVKVAEAYQHCFEEAHYLHPYRPLYHPPQIFDGCFLEAYANHTCSKVKPQALACFRRNVTNCDYRERLFAIADESGGACYGNHVNRLFKENVLDYLQPVRGDSQCFALAERAYECYIDAGNEMVRDNPSLQVLSIDEFMPVADRFFDSIYNCYIGIYKSNRPLCENWQIPLLLELQGTALPSLFGMSFTADQMRRLQLHGRCSVDHLFGLRPRKRTCYENGQDLSDNNNNNNNDNNNDNKKQFYVSNDDNKDHQQQQEEQKKKKGNKGKKMKKGKEGKKGKGTNKMNNGPSQFVKRLLERRRTKRNLFPLF